MAFHFCDFILYLIFTWFNNFAILTSWCLVIPVILYPSVQYWSNHLIKEWLAWQLSTHPKCALSLIFQICPRCQCFTLIIYINMLDRGSSIYRGWNDILLHVLNRLEQLLKSPCRFKLLTVVKALIKCHILVYVFVVPFQALWNIGK